MAIATLIPHPELISPWFIVAAVLSVAVGLFSVYFQTRAAYPKDAPKLAPWSWPIIGNRGFFSERFTFMLGQAKQSPTGQFGYYVGSMPVIGLSGKDGRRLFFDSKKLNFDKGYKALFAGSPDSDFEETFTTDDGQYQENYFTRKLLIVLKRERLQTICPLLFKDVRDGVERLIADPTKMTDPFDSIYDILFVMLMRAVAANELAQDHELRRKMSVYYDFVESSSSPTTIMYPWVPTPSKLKRMYGGSRIYMTFDKLIKDREKTGRREDDALQVMIDDGDGLVQIITFVIAALYAGQLNSGINASWIFIFLSQNPRWYRAVQDELVRVVDRHVPDTSLSLTDRLGLIPFSAWETEFPVIDTCLRETIRVATPGAGFRKNATGASVPINDKESVPPGFYATYHLADVHLDPEIYPEPMTWEPGRYINDDGTSIAHPQGENDPKDEHWPRWVGWGAGRHPCIGMKFAKLEMNLIVAIWMSLIDFEMVSPAKGLPKWNPQAHCSQKVQGVRLKYWER